MKRTFCAALSAFFGLLPITASADTNLQPPLDQVLAPAPIGYSVIQLQGFPHGFFGLDTLAGLFGANASADASQKLQQDGFVGGYSLQWFDQATRRALIEYAVAFQGGKGAATWFAHATEADLMDPTYKHANTIPGLNVTGEHNAFSDGSVADSFLFVKGNDMFVVGFISTKDDVLDLAINQTRSQYAKAPDATIPSDQWPENQHPASDSFPTGVLIGVVVLLMLAALGAGGYFLLMQQRSRQTAVPVAAAPVALQMSPDGNFWFDGARWVDSKQDPPPFAQRSPDGSMWWDGYHWRPVSEARAR